MRVRVPARAVGDFFSPELSFCADSHWVSVPPRVTAVARKRPLSYAKSAGGWLHLNTHTLMTRRSRSGLTMLSKHSVGTYQGNKLTCNSSGITPQMSQLAEPLWTDSGLKSGIGVRELISTSKKKKKGTGEE